MQRAKFTISGPKVSSLSIMIRKKLNPSFEYLPQSKSTLFFAFESYSFLSNTDLAGTILVDLIDENSCNILVMAAGGKKGMLRWDFWGSESSAVNKLIAYFKNLAKENGWEFI